MNCLEGATPYAHAMPRLWSDTIEAHRRSVRDAVLDATAALIAEHGLLSVSMSRIAEDTGIGRATLYKYFPDVESILVAWHDRQMAAHLAALMEARDRGGDAAGRLRAVLETYALIRHQSAQHLDSHLATSLHGGQTMVRAEQQVQTLVRDLLAEAIAGGTVRGDVPADDLAAYCLHALSAAAGLRSKAAVQALVRVTLDGLRPPSP